MNIDDLAIQASDILDTVENYQFELGKIANEVVDTLGYKALEDFSMQIEKIGGVKRSASTLRMYAHIYKISTKLELPKDILFSACQAIVFSDNPSKYAKMARKGASGTDIRKAIYENKYKA